VSGAHFDDEIKWTVQQSRRHTKDEFQQNPRPSSQGNCHHPQDLRVPEKRFRQVSLAPFPFYATTCPRWRSRSTRSSDEVHVERFGSSDDKSPRAPPVELEP
jgi:hypothetical protein